MYKESKVRDRIVFVLMILFLIFVVVFWFGYLGIFHQMVWGFQDLILWFRDLGFEKGEIIELELVEPYMQC